jgi:hypothetical protein
MTYYNKDIKLLALDIDGTLIDKDYIIKQPVKDIVKRVQQETDIKVVLASGRMSYSTKIVADELNITLPAVVYQGAMIKDLYKDEILFHKTIDPENSLKIIKDIEEEDIHVNVYIQDQLYMTKISEAAKVYSSYRNVEPVIIPDFSIVKNNPPTKILGLDRDTRKVEALKERLQKKYISILGIFASNPVFIEVIRPDLNKGKTLFKMAEDFWNIPQENIMAIGDGENDYEMVKGAGTGIAMGNATDKVKEVACYVSSPVSEFGAICAIEKFIFGGK